jgi:hypothetical protein
MSEDAMGWLLCLVGALVLACGCGHSATTVYRDSWQPIAVADANGRQRVLVATLLVGSDDLESLQDAGGTLIGYHAAKKGFALRAGSTGGTHILPVAETEQSRSDCFSLQPTNLVGFSQCTSSVKSRWTRVAVFRVEPDKWHELPVWLIPPSAEMIEGVPATAWRSGCHVEHGRGGVRCDSDWTVWTTPLKQVEEVEDPARAARVSGNAATDENAVRDDPGAEEAPQTGGALIAPLPKIESASSPPDAL